LFNEIAVFFSQPATIFFFKKKQQQPQFPFTQMRFPEINVSTRSLKQEQAVSGTLISVFTSAHLVNLLAAHWGPLSYDEVQSILRLGYRVRIIEFGLFFAIVTHVGTSLILMKRKNAFKLDAWNRGSIYFKIHKLSGYYNF
jgi:hypothetical protein